MNYPMVYICSPYASGCMNENIENARKYCRFALEKHYMPIAPHLLFPQFVDELLERDMAMRLDKELLGKCEELWVFGARISTGMGEEIREAMREHMPIRYYLEKWNLDNPLPTSS